MSYTRSLLARGEEIVFESRQHWFAVIRRSVLVIVVAILALAVLLWAAAPPDGGLDSYVEIVTLAVLVASLLRIGWVVWGWRNMEFLVTTRRIIRAEGILTKVMADASLEKVNDAHLTQTLLGRIFGYGDLDVLTAADEAGGVEDFPMLADPVEFKIAMLNQKQMIERPDLADPAYQRQPAPPPMRRAEPMAPRAGSQQVTVVPEQPPLAEPPLAPAPSAAPMAVPPPPPSAVDETAATLERLAGLRDRGLITPEEYEAKKRELLGRI